MVRFVIQLPNYSAAGKTFSRRHGPARKCLTRRFTSRRRTIVVERISIIENKQRAHSVLVKTLHQSFIGRKIITPALRLGEVPFEVHADPTKTGVGNHFHFTRLWIGEVDIDSESTGERLGSGGRR